MQYSVPQFTEVEDKLIASLSIRQFFILFFAGLIIFAGYSATKSMAALVILCLIFGLPSVALSFAKINGRPAYRQLPFLVKFFTAPKRLVFHKEAASFSVHTKMKDVELAKRETQAGAALGNTQTRIREVQDILEKQREEERELAGKIK